MKSRLLIAVFLFIGVWSYGQDCPNMLSPLPGATNVPIDATINWEPVEGTIGYIISLGTTPGGTDILNSQPTGGIPSYTPPLGLPDNTQIFVTITLFFFNLPDIVCPSQSFTTENVVTAPGCTNIDSPTDGDVDVNIGANISWNYAYSATGYIITIGTAPGLGDIVNSLDVGNTLTYNPPADLPDLTEIFVEVIPYNENGNIGSCAEESFTTGELAALPGCSNIIYPTDGEINVALSPFVEWEAVPGATGYRVYIGRTPFDNDILDGGIFTNNSTFVINFEANSIYFIRIVPFNDAGEAIGCGQTSFSTVLGCGPFFDPDSGDLVTLNPELNFPDQVGICLNEVPTTVNATDPADGYRWYKLDAFGEFALISEESSVELSENGTYRIEAYNVTNNVGIEIECPTIHDFEVVSSEAPTIEGVNIFDDISGISILVTVSGSGDYEYALDNINGPYQDSNSFDNVSEDVSVIYVRDKNGCGIDQYFIDNLIVAKGFPKFFTPNNDGYKDFWQYIPKDEDDFIMSTISIFDRYGKLLKTIKHGTRGWDGTVNGVQLPTAGFWYRAEASDGKIFVGYFTLRR